MRLLVDNLHHDVSTKDSQQCAWRKKDAKLEGDMGFLAGGPPLLP
jgi:hypothetical protein